MEDLNNIRMFFGFTLAEVLITLGIIGVVAALTIPQLIANYQKTQYVTQLKKAYAEFNQALIQLAADKGCVGDLQCTGDFSTGTNHQMLGDELVKYFKVTKNCTILRNRGCWPESTGSTGHHDDTALYKFITVGGMSFYINNYVNNCDTPTYSTGRTGNMTQTCGLVMIDVNGLKEPNDYGRDTFVFFITNGRGPLLYPYGGADAAWNNGGSTGDYWWRNPITANPRYCLANSPNTYCAGRIMEEGWEMNY